MGTRTKRLLPTQHFLRPNFLFFQKRKILKMHSIANIVVVIFLVLGCAVANARKAPLRQNSKFHGTEWQMTHQETVVDATFMMSASTANHDGAVAKCAEYGGHLAVLDTHAKLNFVKEHIPVDTWVYIGAECVGCEKVEEDKWEWNNGEKLSLDHPLWGYYHGGQAPYDDSGDDALYLYYKCKTAEERMFVNFAGSHHEKYLCEK